MGESPPVMDISVSRADLRAYRGLRVLDVPLWRQHLQGHHGRYERIVYAARLAGQAARSLATSPEMERDGEHLLSKRPDALALREDGTLECIEVKPRATFATIGQALGYADLAKRALWTNGQRTPLRPGSDNPLEDLAGKKIGDVVATIICAGIDPDTAPFRREWGILTYVYSEYALAYERAGYEEP